MNAAELIASGLLEAYVLGQVSPEEARLVQASRSSDPLVAGELDAIEATLQEFALRNAVPPPATSKASIFEHIEALNSKVQNSKPIIPFTQASPIATARSTGSFSTWLAAASIAALVISGAFNVIQYQRLEEARTEVARLENDKAVLAEDLNVQRASYEQSQGQLAVVMDPQRKAILLNGVGNAIGEKARIYWDQKASAVHIDPMTLAELPAGQQYQLWALVNGTPIDAGMIEKGVASHGLQRMKDVPQAQAFAITIEKEGGSLAPTLEAMVVMGQV